MKNDRKQALTYNIIGHTQTFFRKANDGHATLSEKTAMRIAVILSLLPALLLSACAAFFAPPQFPIVDSPSAIVTQDQSPCLLTPARALELMYGEDALSVTETEVLLPAPYSGYTTTVHLNLMTFFWENAAEQCLVITNSAFDNSHVNQATIDGAIFRWRGDSWKLAAFQPNLISLGSFGYVPKGSLVHIGPDKHAALLRSKWEGQGYASEYATIITEVNGSLRVVLHLLMSERQETFDKDGVFLKWGYQSELAFRTGSHSDFDDIVVTQYGVNQDGDHFNRMSVYAFSDGRSAYMPVNEK